MFYTMMNPSSQSDRVYLYPNVDAARTSARVGDIVYEVAVRFDARGHYVAPLRSGFAIADPDWTTPAYAEPDGAVIAKAPIPESLFETLVLSRADHIPIAEPGAAGRP